MVNKLRNLKWEQSVLVEISQENFLVSGFNPEMVDPAQVAIADVRSDSPWGRDWPLIACHASTPPPPSSTWTAASPWATTYQKRPGTRCQIWASRRDKGDQSSSRICTSFEKINHRKKFSKKTLPITYPHHHHHQVVVVGGGAVGDSIAYHLAKIGAGAGVLLLEVSSEEAIW